MDPVFTLDSKIQQIMVNRKTLGDYRIMYNKLTKESFDTYVIGDLYLKTDNPQYN